LWKCLNHLPKLILKQNNSFYLVLFGIDPMSFSQHTSSRPDLFFIAHNTIMTVIYENILYKQIRKRTINKQQKQEKIFILVQLV